MKKRILVIEDDQAIRENTSEILELAGYKVITAPNGKEGSILAKELTPHLIVCDIMMPGLDGYGVLHILSKDPLTASIPFIFLTAKAEKSEWRKGMELGADDYITKPFEDTDLLNAIEVRLKKSENLKKEFSRDLDGFNQFLDQAKGLKDLQDLSQSRSVSKYKKREVVYHDGDVPHYLLFLNHGMIKAYKTNEEGKEFITHIYKKGDFFGFAPMFENKSYSDSALALEESEICKIPKSDFLSLVYKNRDVASKFIKMLSNHVAEQENQLLRLAYDTVRKRTAETLLQLQKRYDKDGNGKFPITVTREDFASMAGTVTETAIRCLSEFEEDRFIEVNGRDIFVLNKKGLENIQ